jgi:hypothetical protein
VREVTIVSDRLQCFLLHDLEYCRGKNTRDAVMEDYLGAALVRPHLSCYYLLKEDALMQSQIISSIQQQLE